MSDQPKANMTMRVSSWYVTAGNRRGNLGHFATIGA
jgi:hypothetical protein